MKDQTPSKTALLIAQLVILGQHSKSFASLNNPASVDVATKCVSKSHPLGSFWVWILKQHWMLSVGYMIERRLLPGFIAHVVSRKHIIGSITADLIRKAKISQVISIGAGYDGLLTVLPSEIARFEIDHPATQYVKTTALKAYVNAPNFLAADLSKESITTVFYSGNVSISSSTLIIIEGVLMYLTQTQVKNLLRSIQEYFSNDLWILFTFMEPDDKQIVQFHSGHNLINRVLKKISEPFKWGVVRSDLQKFLEPIGFTLAKISDTQLEDSVTAKGEALCLCHKNKVIA